MSVTLSGARTALRDKSSPLPYTVAQTDRQRTKPECSVVTGAVEKIKQGGYGNLGGWQGKSHPFTLRTLKEAEEAGVGKAMCTTADRQKL